jgi:sigma-B regulation protein RsbU (phosphoserine phosphatase)
MELTSPPAGPGGLVLVVDDDADNRELLRRRLESEGHMAIEASGGAQAFEALACAPVDVILLDILMPEMNGYEVLERLKAHSDWSRIPVIVISSLDQMDSIVRCVELGASDYLHKPFNRVLLRARVSACLEQKRLRDREQWQYRALEESQARLRAELAEAAAYVRSLLPTPLRGEVRADWEYIPSTSLGGDALGYHALDADQLAIYLLDVCGHGVGAALLAVSILDALRPGALGEATAADPGAVLAALNGRFPMERHNNMYFTAWYGVYRRSTGELAYANGGHPPAVLLPPGGAEPLRLTARGIVVGAWPDARFETGRCDVEPGSHLYLFSDGAYELARGDGTPFDYSGLVELLRADAARPATDSSLELSQEISRLVGGTFDDDFSMLRVVL